MADQVVQLDGARTRSRASRRCNWPSSLGIAKRRLGYAFAVPSLDRDASPPSGAREGRSTIARYPPSRWASTDAAIWRSTPPPAACVISTTASTAASPRRAPAREVQAPPCLRQRVRRRMRRDQFRVAGMQPLQQSCVARPQVPCRRAERMSADMRDEYPWCGHIPPAQVAGAQAKVVLLAIALGEQVGAQQADCVQAGPANIQAEPDSHRDVDRAAAIHPSRQGINARRRGKVRHVVAAASIGIVQDRSVVRQRRHCADIARAVSDAAQFLQPAGGRPACRCSAAPHRVLPPRACR